MCGLRAGSVFRLHLEDLGSGPGRDRNSLCGFGASRSPLWAHGGKMQNDALGGVEEPGALTVGLTDRVERPDAT